MFHCNHDFILVNGQPFDYIMPDQSDNDLTINLTVDYSTIFIGLISGIGKVCRNMSFEEFKHLATQKNRENHNNNYISPLINGIANSYHGYMINIDFVECLQEIIGNKLISFIIIPLYGEHPILMDICRYSFENVIKVNKYVLLLKILTDMSANFYKYLTMFNFLSIKLFVERYYINNTILKKFDKFYNEMKTTGTFNWLELFNLRNLISTKNDLYKRKILHHNVILKRFSILILNEFTYDEPEIRLYICKIKKSNKAHIKCIENVNISKIVDRYMNVYICVDGIIMPYIKNLYKYNVYFMNDTLTNNFISDILIVY